MKLMVTICGEKKIFMAPHLSLAHQQQQFAVSRSQLPHISAENNVHIVGLQVKPQSERPLRPAAAIEVYGYSHRKKPYATRTL